MKFILILGFALGMGCATAGEGGDDTAADARTFIIVDSAPGSPDAPNNPTPDAMNNGTPDAMQTPDAMVGPPDAQGCTLMIQQLLSNNTLDAGSGGGWIENGAGYPIILSQNDPTYPLPPGILPLTSGTYAAWMGGLDGATRALYQDVTIPASATNMTVTGYRWIASQETPGIGVYDTMTLPIRNTSNAVLENLVSLSNENQADAWIMFVGNPITNFAGQTVRFYLETYTDAFPDTNTNFFLDTFTLNVTVCQ